MAGCRNWKSFSFKRIQILKKPLLFIPVQLTQTSLNKAGSWLVWFFWRLPGYFVLAFF